ncbi:hypothetical protein ACF0H5_019273 [Mactra antiquata]
MPVQQPAKQKTPSISKSRKMQWNSTVDSPMILTNRSIYTNTFLDIMNMPQIAFNKSYKNPCWVGIKDNGPLDDGRFHCLPYFYIIGVKKSGTSDLYSRISYHPDILKKHVFKESQWISRCRFYGSFPVRLCDSPRYQALAKKVDMRSLGFYTGLYAPSSSVIRKTYHVGHSENNNSGKIFGDATPANFHLHYKWSELPGNEGLTEPKYTNFHYIKHLIPEAKIIVIFRDPVSRLFSDFKYEQIGKVMAKPEIMLRQFHNQCVQMIKHYEECFNVYSRRQCIFDSTKPMTRQRMMFTAGFYAFFMKEMFEVFDKKNILPILMTDYTSNMKNTLSKVFDFLELDQPNEEQWTIILNEEVMNESKGDKRIEMFDETKRVLQEFYRPLNEEMAKLMNDSRYLFN